VDIVVHIVNVVSVLCPEEAQEVEHVVVVVVVVVVLETDLVCLFCGSVFHWFWFYSGGFSATDLDSHTFVFASVLQPDLLLFDARPSGDLIQMCLDRRVFR